MLKFAGVHRFSSAGGQDVKIWVVFFANLQKNLLSPLGAYSICEFRSPG